jgi:hypothetical protein
MVGVVNVAFVVGRITAEPLPVVAVGVGTSSVEGFSGDTERFRDDCGLPRAFLKNWTVGFGVVDVEASVSDMMRVAVMIVNRVVKGWQASFINCFKNTRTPRLDC